MLRHLGGSAWRRETSPGKGSALTLNTDGPGALGPSELARPGRVTTIPVKSDPPLLCLN